MPPPPRQPHPGVNGGSSAADTPTPPPPLPDAPPPMETPPTPAAAASRLDMLVGGGSSMKSQPTSRLVHTKTPSSIPGQRCPENLEISIITDVRFSNFNNSELVKGINELLSYSKNLVF